MNIVITGGSKGMGKALATKYAVNGNNIFICARNLKDLASAALEIKQKNNWFTRLGFGLGYIVSNQTFESAKRVQHLSDEGNELPKPIEKLIFQYREIDAFDIHLKVGAGKNFTFGKIKCNASVAYSQGLLKKDTGIRTGVLECSLGFSLH